MKEELSEDTDLRRKTLQIAGLTILLFGMICSGCRQKTAVNAEQKDSEQIEYAATESTETASESEKQETKKLVIEDLDDAYEALLDSCSKEFIGDYRIDESFLNWIYANYGKDAVLNIAKESQEEQDVNIWYKETGNSIHVLWLLYCQATGMNEEDLQQVYWKTCNSPDEIVLDFTGDINFAEGWGTTEHMDGQPNGINDCFSKDLLQEMNNADIMTESGKVIRKLRHSSIKRMRAKLRHWEKEYPAGLVTREQILQSWQAWDAHAAHGNTWALRQQVRDRVQNILKEEI